MKKVENPKEESNLSKSKQKRMAQSKKTQADRRAMKRGKLIGICALAAVVILIGVIIAIGAVNKANRVTAVAASTDCSQMLDDNGFISGVKATDYVTLPADVDNIQVPYSEIEYMEDSINEDIASALSAHQILNDDESKKVASGDKINIDYEGKVDGNTFDGGSYEGYDLTIGSGVFLEGFEDQLIDAKVGSTVNVNVTFPEDYSNADVAGKDAVFTVKVNGIYEDPAYNDDFVKEYYSAYADTAEGYREYIRSVNEKDALKTWLETYLSDNSEANKYPDGYVKLLQKVLRYGDEEDYNSMNEYYYSFTGQTMYSSFADYINMSENEYAKSLKTEAMDTAKMNMVYQAILEKNGVTVSGDDYKSYLEAKGDTSTYDTYVSKYGVPYTVEQYVKLKAIEILSDKATIVTE